MRLIDADALTKKLHETICGGCNGIKTGACGECGNGEIYAVIDAAPTVDAVEVTKCRECENGCHL